MYRKLILLILCLLFIAYISLSFKISNLDDNVYINVEVKGAIKENIGTINLLKGSTFNDLLNQIELNEDADISTYSLNSVLYNNQIINIPTKSNNTLISINNASLDLLCSLPSVGKSTALKIIEYRENYGSFMSLEEIMNVSGIGEKKFEKIKPYITL